PAGSASASEADLARTLAEINQSLKEERWEDAIHKCDQVLRLRPDHEQARDHRQRAEAERKNRDAFTAYTKAASGGDWDGSVRSYSQITDDSVYKDRARKSWDDVKRGFLKDHLARESKLVSAGRCDDARREVEQIQSSVEDAGGRAAELLRSCGKDKEKDRQVTSGELPRPPRTTKDGNTALVASKRPPRVTPTGDKEVVKPAVGADSAEADALAAQGQEAYVNGKYGLAIDLCTRARKLNQHHGLATRVMGAAFCKLRQKDGALKA